jgi:hypothetical protein
MGKRSLWTRKLNNLKINNMAYSEKPIKMKTNQDGGSYTAKDPAAAAKQLKENQLMKKGKMNRYDKDMMHERELIYDAKKEIHKEDVAKKHHEHVVNRVAGRNSRM